MTQIDIVGMSLAELSLILIFVVLVGVRRNPNARSRASDAVRQVEQLNSQLALAHSKIDSLQTEKRQLQKRINAFTASRPNLRSTALPSCAEIKIRSEWLFTAVITGPDHYDIAGVGALSLHQILNRFKSQLEEGRSRGCVQRIQVGVGDNVSAKDYDLALRHLEEFFYPKMLGGAQ